MILPKANREYRNTISAYLNGTLSYHEARAMLIANGSTKEQAETTLRDAWNGK